MLEFVVRIVSSLKVHAASLRVLFSLQFLPREPQMNRLKLLLATMIVLCAGITSLPVAAAEMSFQVINDTDRPLNMKIFSRGESRQQWPSKTRAYSIRPDAAVQQITITCEEGEQVCWGAWLTVQVESGEVNNSGRRSTSTTQRRAGAGENGQRSCSHCCHVCKDGAKTPVAQLRDPNPEAR
jgi:hypothetical protein